MSNRQGGQKLVIHMTPADHGAYLADPRNGLQPSYLGASAEDLGIHSDVRRFEQLLASVGAGFERLPVNTGSLADTSADPIPPTAAIALTLNCVEFLFTGAGEYLGMRWFAPDETTQFEPRTGA